MKKIILALTLGVTFSTGIFSQNAPTADEEKKMKALAAADSGWTRKGSVSIGATGSYFNQWAAGGINSVGINSLLNYGLTYKVGQHNWENTIIIAYGMMNQGFATSDAWVKTDDRFDFTSKYGRPINDKLFYALLFNFNTQFAPGYAPGADGRPDRNKVISNFAAPARMMFSLGLDYKPKPELSIFFSPATYRGIYVFDDLLAAQGAFGVEKGEIIPDTLETGEIREIIVKEGAHARHEVGAYLRVNYAKKFNENFNLTSKLELFSNYLENPQNVDLAWETISAWKIGKYFSFSATVNFIYDDNTNITKLHKVNVTDDEGNIVTDANGNPVQVDTPYLSKGLQTRIVSTLGLTYNF